MSEHSAPDEGVALAFDQDFDGAQSPAKPLGEDGLRTAKPCGPGARGWRQAAGGQQSPTGIRLTFNPAATEARGIRLRGEHGISRKTTAQGMPECSGCSCMLVCASLRIYCTRDRGCSKHPAFPAPSDFLGKGFLQSSGETRRENAEVCSMPATVIASEAKQSISPRKERMDCFVASLLAMTNTWIQFRLLAAHCARAFPSTVRPQIKRAQGMPGACCTRGLVCNVHEEVRTRAYRYSRSSPAFPAQWVYGLYRALPGDEFLLPPSPAD